MHCGGQGRRPFELIISVFGVNLWSPLGDFLFLNKARAKIILCAVARNSLGSKTFNKY